MFIKKKMLCALAVLIFFAAAPLTAAQEEKVGKEDAGLSLITATPEEGFQLAITLARKGVTETQPDKEILKELRTAYAHDPNSLISSSQVIAIFFQTIAEANEYWRVR